MKKRSKRYKKIINSIKDKKIESVEKIIETVKVNSNTKFSESVDLSFKINLKKIKAAENTLRTIIELPNGSGKKLKLLFCVMKIRLMMQKKVVQSYSALMI